MRLLNHLLRSESPQKLNFFLSSFADNLSPEGLATLGPPSQGQKGIWKLPV